MTPILLNHDHTRALGYLKFDRGRLIARFNPPISRVAFFEIFPGAGVRFADRSLTDGTDRIVTAEILEFSRMTKPHTD